MWWRRSHRSNNKEGLRRTKELHLLDHCCRQHLRHRPTADDGRARCLVMENSLHRCDGCGFIFSIARIITSATTWQDAASCCTHITTTYCRRCEFILSISYHASLVLVFNDASSRPAVRRQGRRRTGKYLRPVQRVHACHEFVPPADGFNRFNVQPIMPKGGGLPPSSKPER